MGMERSDATRVLVGGAAAGAVGSVAMTAFQKLVAMPITRWDDSFVPAKMAAKLLGLEPQDRSDWVRLNYAAHATVGLTWGIALSAARSAGLTGQRRVATVYGALWDSYWLALGALGTDGPPWTWRGATW